MWVICFFWLGFGAGRRLAIQALAVVCGIFAEGASFKIIVIPELTAVTAVAISMIILLQILWKRSRTEIKHGESGWEWTGRSGPSHLLDSVWSPGGSWIKSREGKWYFVPKGFSDEEGNDWLVAGHEKSRFGLLSPASPALAFLILILSVGIFTARPYSLFRGDIRNLVTAIKSHNENDISTILQRRVELKPYVRFLSTLPACSDKRCLNKQMAARLEMDSIGPFFGVSRSVLYRLLILQGKVKLVQFLTGPESRLSLELAIRKGNPGRARQILRENVNLEKNLDKQDLALLLLQESKYDKALAVVKRAGSGNVYRNLSIWSVAAYMAGDCIEVEKSKELLYFPEEQVKAYMSVRKKTSTGLGSLQRVADRIIGNASFAIACMLDGEAYSANVYWEKAEEIAEFSGIPGVLDRDRILMKTLGYNFTEKGSKNH